jgi:hypothetical protein
MSRYRLFFVGCACLSGLLVACAWLLAFSRPTPTWAHRDQAGNTIRCVQPGNPSCFATIQAALAASNPGDTIRVAAGTYVEYVIITKTVTLEGGWNASFTARDPQVNVTTIRPPDASFSVVFIQGKPGDPAAVAPTLDGFTITGGGGGNHGGGLRITNSNARIQNNHITGNLGYLLGGGVWVQNGAPLLINNRIEGNHINQSSGGWGGGVELESARATLTGNLIANNTISDSVGYGGGVAIEGGGPVTLTNNTIVYNTAATLTSAAPANDVAYGGGVFIEGANVNLTGNLIQENLASGIKAFSFGGAWGFGGGVFIRNSTAFTLTGNTIITNTASYKYYLYPSGGGLQIETSNGTLAGNIIAGNHANGNILFGNGGGLAIYTSTLSIQGGQIRNNVTSINDEGYGGGLYARKSEVSLDTVLVKTNSAGNSPYYGLGGGLAFFSTPYTITNGIVAKNYAYPNDTSVGGLYADSKSPGHFFNNTLADNKGQGIRSAAPITLTNNIIMGQTTGISMTAHAPASANFNLFYNNTTHQRGFSLNSSNIIINPQLDGDYHLTHTSPAIDAGTRDGAPLHDFDDQPRPMRGISGFYRFDIGADEITGTAQTTRNLATQPADFTLIGPGNPQDNPTSDGSNDWIGNAVLGGDISGDGRDDLVVGAQNLSSSFSGGVNDDGRVFALYNPGIPRLGAVDLLTTTANLEVRSWIHQQHIGQSFAAADLNGDDHQDLLIGASGAAGFNVLGSVFIFSGGSSLAGTRTLSPTMQANYRILADQNTGAFAGANALAVGQLDGSGPEDLAVGDAGASALGRDQAGVVHIFFGSPGFPSTWDLKTTPASLTIFGPAANAQLGGVSVADVNGDGKPDLIARSDSTVYVFFGPLGPGAIDLASQQANLSAAGLAAGRLAAGDLNGDGRAEVIVGAAKQVRVLDGGSLSLLATFTGPNASALQTLDWNADGKADLVIGDDLSNRVYVILGSAALSGSADILDRADWVFSGAQTAEHFGFGLGSGDLDADGRADLVIGSRSHVLTSRLDPHFNDAGEVYVFYSSTSFQPVLYGLQMVTIAGPLSGTANTLYAFSASASPLTATLPVTFTWSPAPNSGQGASQATYSWSNTGQKTIQVLASNPVNSVSDSHTILITAPAPVSRIYLPAFLRK